MQEPSRRENVAGAQRSGAGACAASTAPEVVMPPDKGIRNGSMEGDHARPYLPGSFLLSSEDWASDTNCAFSDLRLLSSR